MTSLKIPTLMVLQGADGRMTLREIVASVSADFAPRFHRLSAAELSTVLASLERSKMVYANRMRGTWMITAHGLDSLNEVMA